MDPARLGGTWVFNAAKSTMTTPVPQSWIQRIAPAARSFSIREEIVSADGSSGTVIVDAACDGRDYPVSGSPIADSIAYTSIDSLTLSGTGRKDGHTSLTETVAVSEDGRLLTITYAIFSGTRIIANGTAVFDRLV